MSFFKNILTSTATAAAGKSMLPWLILAAVMALSATGVAGMYAGYELSEGRHARSELALQQAQNRALLELQGRFEAAQKRGDEISGRFEARLDNLKIENKSFFNETRLETQKLVYTDCKLPASGADLLKRRVDATNTRLLGTIQEKK